MKKFFSLFAAVLFAGSMMAADVTLNYAGKGYENAYSLDGVDVVESGVTFTLAKGTGSSAPAYYNTGTGARTYGGNTLTIDAGSSTITKIVFDFSQNNKDYTVNAGTYTKASSEWAGSATSVVFTTESGSGHNRIKSITVTLSEGGDPTPVVEYYVVGSMNNWELSADYKLAANPAQAGEYMKRFTFAANDELKVRKAVDGVLDTWYPEGVGNNWVITEDGQYDVYFRPEGNTEWANGFFFVAPYVIPQYEVAEAIAAGLTDGTEIKVRGVVSKIEFKGTNFKTFGSANIYVNDATGAEGSFEFYNCYSMNADTFKVSVPAWDATSTSYAQFTEVSDANGYTIHVGDTVIAQGKYLYYAKNSVHELNTGCFIIYAKEPDAEFPTAIDNTNIDAKVVKFFENGQLVIIKNGVRYNAQGAVVR